MEELKNENKSIHKKRNVLIIVFVVIILLSLVGGGIYYISQNVDKTNNNENGFKEASANIETNTKESISFDNMSASDENLTDIQKDVISYFDNDYFWFSAKEAQMYPQVFQNANVVTSVAVVKVLESTNDSFKVVGVDCGPSMYNYYENTDLKDIPTEQLIVVSGKQLNQRLITGDLFAVYGKYEDVKNTEIDGKTYMVSNIKANNIVRYNGEDYIKKHDYDKIKNVAEFIFGKDIKISEDNNNSDYYKIVLDNQSNANFKSFNMSKSTGSITYNQQDNNLNSNIEKHLYISANFEHYIVTTYDINTKHLYVDYFSKNLEKLWGREFDYTSTEIKISPMDYTSDKMAIVIDNDLYLIDLETGENIIEPVLVGGKIKVNMMEDGIILVGSDTKDRIMKVDYKGNIIFKINSKEYDMEELGDIYEVELQVIDGKLVIILSTEYGEAYQYMVINSNGEVEIDS